MQLKDFLIEWLERGVFSTAVEDHLGLTDNEVLSAIRLANRKQGAPGHAAASRIARRTHFRPVYERNSIDQKRNPNSADLVEKALVQKYGGENVRRDQYAQKSRG